MQHETCANKSSSSLRSRISSESSPLRKNGESTRQRRLGARASNMKGGYGSRTTSTPRTSLRSTSKHKTLLNRQEVPALKEASSSTQIPLSPNYFDVLSKEQEAPPEENAVQETEREFPGLQRVIALSTDSKGKAPMLLREQEEMVAEETLLSALHRSREEAQRSCLRAKGLQIG